MINSKTLREKIMDDISEARVGKPKLNFDTLMPLLIAKKTASRFKKSQKNATKKPGDDFSPLLISSTDKLTEIIDWAEKQVLLKKDVKIDIPIIFDDGKHHNSFELIVENGNIKLIFMESLETAINENREIISYHRENNERLIILQKPITQIQQKDGIVCSAISLNNLADMSRLNTDEKLSDCIPLFNKKGVLNKVDKTFLLENAEKINPHFVKNVQSISFNEMFFSKNNTLLSKNSCDQKNSKKHISSRYNILFIQNESDSYYGCFKLSNAAISKKREGYLQEIAKITNEAPEELLQSIISESKKIDEKRLSQYIEGNDPILSSTKELSMYNLTLSTKDKILLAPSNHFLSETYKNLSDFQKGIFIFTNLMQEHAKSENQISFENFLKNNDIEINPIISLINSKFEQNTLEPICEKMQKRCFEKIDIKTDTLESCFDLFLKMLPLKELSDYMNINEEAFVWLLTRGEKLSNIFKKTVNDHFDNLKSNDEELDKLKGILKYLDNYYQNKSSSPKP